MSTKAATFFEFNQNNDLASAALKAAVDNDYDAFLDALKDADMDEDALALSQEEFDRMVEGVKPSGELDLAVWTGYYEATAGGEFAFAIFPSSPTTVYWGLRSQLLDQPKTCTAQYRLSGTQLELTTITHGEVTITFARQYDETTTEVVTTSFQALIKGKDKISGILTIPPVHAREQYSRAALALSAVGDEKPWEIPSIYDIAWLYGPAMVTYLGGPAAIYQLAQWAREVPQRRQEISDFLDPFVVRIRDTVRQIARRNADTPEVDLEAAREGLLNDVRERANQEMADNPPDFDRESAEATTERLREPAMQETEASLRRFVEGRVGPILQETLDRCKFVQNPDQFIEEIIRQKVSEMIEPHLKALGPSSSYDVAVRPPVYDVYAEHCRNNYNDKEQAEKGAERELAEARRHTQTVQGDLTAIKKKIEEDEREGKDTSAEEVRKTQLEHDLDDATAVEREKEASKTQAEKDQTDAERKRDKAEKDKREDHSGEKWEKKVREALR
ncbi:hypothetical protein ASPZODRAFT_20181 [Penicilliopsis zonata CBS 506.65]|uniref:Uncharacterized protein n=1 Tax=Penicilliopsis zonata CBS 506.65 TaxID=1073090 RepID=A0A1L9S653_9EURO|nr:hypothetical protein ASPZODRAFT_20181 [Penicilliopsis zonata CBS 506.65]OJJ42654.1 hypothetical protein ASPZODRAFT_20181 [Penicilliopsis zonata CBS 506.65]